MGLVGSHTLFMEVHLKPEQEEFIQHRVSAGAYASIDDAVQAAIDLLEERESGGRGAVTGARTGADLVAAMQASPFKDVELESTRPVMHVRDVSF